MNPHMIPGRNWNEFLCLKEPEVSRLPWLCKSAACICSSSVGNFPADAISISTGVVLCCAVPLRLYERMGSNPRYP